MSFALWRPANLVRVSLVFLCLWLCTAVAAGLVIGRHWQIVNDAALIRYITLMLDSGRAPYRQVLDMDLPGTFLIDHLVVHYMGAGATAWRCFDACVMLGASVAMASIARPFGWFAGICSALVYWLTHLRDGMGQAGQRDLIEAALLLMTTALFLRFQRTRVSSLIWLAGICSGVASTIKPDSLVFALGLFLYLASQRWRFKAPGKGAALALLLGLLTPWLVVFLYLWHEHSLYPFWKTITEILPYYASLGRQPVFQLLRSWLPSPLRVLAVLAVVLAVANRRRWTATHTLLAAGLLWGFGSFLFQGKGYPYQRYPSAAFLLSLAGILCAQALTSGLWLRRIAGTAVVYASLVIAPAALLRIHRAAWNTSLLTALQSDLNALGGRALDHSVQCIDSTVGCNTVLLRLQLHQQTGMLSDFLIFGQAAVPAVQRTRRQFWQEITVRPPRVIIVTGALHPNVPAGVPYAKLASWPAFAHLLDTRYALLRDRNFAPGMSGPLAYRIYVLRDEAH